MYRACSHVMASGLGWAGQRLYQRRKVWDGMIWCLKREFVRDRERRSGGGRYWNIKFQTSTGKLAIAEWEGQAPITGGWEKVKVRTLITQGKGRVVSANGAGRRGGRRSRAMDSQLVD